jgi:methionine synthase II (cobalamin-independent)
MRNKFKANCNCALIGSLPLKEHEYANELVLRYSPEIPNWAQLPVHRKENMVAQFAAGMPGLKYDGDKLFVDAKNKGFETSLAKFYEEYLAVNEGEKSLDDSIFALKREDAEGFFVFIENITKKAYRPVALKGQVTGPFTFCTSISDQNKKAIFYNEQIRDAAVKLLSLKAAWQVKNLLKINVPVILFVDEPALAGYGSSEFTSISGQEVVTCLEEVISSVHNAGGLAGIHVCANTDWAVIFDTKTDIINFDSYSYFDRFILYKDKIKKYIESGGIIAWGIVPTAFPEEIEKQNAQNLIEKLLSQIEEVCAFGIEKEKLLRQSLITPSCGTGSLDASSALKVLELTQAVSRRLREELNIL